MNLSRMKEIGILLVLIVLSLFLSLRTTSFLTTQNILDILKGSAVLGILAFGMTGVILTGGIDVSVAAVTAAVAVIVGTLMPLLPDTWWSLVVVFVAALVAGCLLGLLNGLLISWGEIPPIVVTLGTLSIVGGMTRYLTNGNYINSTYFPSVFMKFADFKIAGVSILTFIFLAVGVVTWYLLRYTHVGRGIYAVGGNPVSAVRAGIRTRFVQLFVYGYMGLLTGVAAITLTAYNKAVDPNGMAGFELVVVAAVVLGGTNIMGGTGGILGTLFGALLLGVVNNGLTLAHINTYWQQIVVGIIILVAVIADAVGRRRLQARLTRIDVE